jgi:hypothetical protein
MSLKQILFTILCLSIWILSASTWLLRHTGAGRAEAAAIILRYFQASGLDNAVRLEWGTASEYNTAGFRLERAGSQTGLYRPLDGIGFIPAGGLGLVGAEYEAVDETAVNGQTYWYKLIEIEYGGYENAEEPIAVTAGLALATNTTPATRNAIFPTPTPLRNNLPPATNIPGTAAGQPGGNVATAVAVNNLLPATAVSAIADATSTPTATTLIIAGQVAAQQIDTPASATAYPGAGTITATAESDETMPPALVTPLPEAPEAYPEGAQPPAPIQPPQNSSNLPIIGSNNQADTDGAPALNRGSATSLNGTSGRLFLWIAFLASLTIFVAGVVGAILLFTRQRLGER